MPPFDQSAMDGYALAAAAIKRLDAELPVVSRVPGGDLAPALPTGAAARVFTGSPVPAGADTVVMQEHVSAQGRLHCAGRPAPPRQQHSTSRRGYRGG